MRLEPAALAVPALVAVRRLAEATLAAVLDLQGAFDLVHGAQQGAVAIVAVHLASPRIQSRDLAGDCTDGRDSVRYGSGT